MTDVGFEITPEHRPIIVGFEGAEPDWDWLEQIRPTGVILFTRNLNSIEQVRLLCQRLRTLRPRPFIAIDMEGGRVNRLQHLIGQFPSMPQAVSSSACFEAGTRMGQLLASLGIDIDFAPVVDLDYGQLSNGLQGRTLGSDPAKVAEHAIEFVTGLNQFGVAGCFKHFPGLGTTVPDSHLSLPTFQGSYSEWDQGEGEVYRLLAAKGQSQVPVMLAHCVMPFWQGEVASWSSKSMQALKSIGWQGITMTDDLEMKAIDEETITSTAARALRAGVDLVMVCRSKPIIDQMVAFLDQSPDCRSARSGFIPHASPVDVSFEEALKGWRSFSSKFIASS